MAQNGPRGGRDRRPRKQQPHRTNGQIQARQVRVIDADGEQLGVMSRDQALKLAREAKLDLVMIAEKADPPVCRLLNYGKFLYQQERKAKEARKHRQKPPHELRLRPAIADGDFNTKCRQAEKFLSKGGKVKLTVQFRGRQNAHPQLGRQLLERFAAELEQVGQVEQMPRQEGNRMSMLLVPTGKPSADS